MDDIEEGRLGAKSKSKIAVKSGKSKPSSSAASSSKIVVIDSTDDDEDNDKKPAPIKKKKSTRSSSVDPSYQAKGKAAVSSYFTKPKPKSKPSLRSGSGEAAEVDGDKSPVSDADDDNVDGSRLAAAGFRSSTKLDALIKYIQDAKVETPDVKIVVFS